MRVLITNAATPLGQTLAEKLGHTHQLRLTDDDTVTTDREFVQSELDHDEATDALVANIDAIVYLAYAPRPGDDETTWLDHNSRRLYNLLIAASETSIKRVIVLSTLELFTPYNDVLPVGNHWKPLPSCEPAVLGAHLAEFTAREFAHSHALKVSVARIGHLVRSAEVADQPFDPLWLDERDLAPTIERILEKSGCEGDSQYSVTHILSDPDRFSKEADG